jgi:hypothetical protein
MDLLSTPAAPSFSRVYKLAAAMAAAAGPTQAERLLAGELRKLARRRERQGKPPDLIAIEWNAFERQVRRAVHLLRPVPTSSPF